MMLDDAMAKNPIIAILRGVVPAEVAGIGDALVRAGVCAIEVPLNSPEPFASIAALADRVGDRAVIGGGTVVKVSDVDRVAEAGGGIVVAPNTDSEVIGRTAELGLTPVPGFHSPSEAFAALEAGARHLKLFPAITGGCAHMKAIRAVLPSRALVYAVGGVRPQDFRLWREAGAAGLGLGSELYRPGATADEVYARAAQAVQACCEV
jgi:2-dehydro-3-deoxyphosphogalactonate aldolase